LSCNDNAVIEIQHTQIIFDLQTPFVEILAGFVQLQTAKKYQMYNNRPSIKVSLFEKVIATHCLYSLKQNRPAKADIYWLFFDK
jgi:hypothetical protein